MKLKSLATMRSLKVSHLSIIVLAISSLAALCLYIAPNLALTAVEPFVITKVDKLINLFHSRVQETKESLNFAILGPVNFFGSMLSVERSFSASFNVYTRTGKVIDIRFGFLNHSLHVVKTGQVSLTTVY